MMNKLTAEKARYFIERINDVEKEFGLSIDRSYYRQALEIALPVLEQQESDGDIFIVMRNPGKVPDIKRPVGDVADYLLELYQHNPDSVCDVITYRFSGVSGQWVQDGREFLAMAGVVLEQQELGDGEWVDWVGGDCPINKVEVKRRDGQFRTGSVVGFRWEHRQNDFDIIAYRVVQHELERGEEE